MKNIATILTFLVVFFAGMFGGKTLIEWVTSFISLSSGWMIGIKVILVFLFTITGGILTFLAAYFMATIVRNLMN
jgi:hypothetical protein